MSSARISCNGHENTDPIFDLKFQICLVGETLRQNKALIKAIEHFNLPVVCSSSGLELINQRGDFITYYVLEEFEGDIFKRLRKARQRIFGPTAVMQYAKKNEALPNKFRPLYTTSMKNQFITFTGFPSKDLTSLVNLVHHMGGSVRSFSINSTTHLVATPNSTSGEDYKYSATCIPIMTAEWILQAWAKRHDVNSYATNEELMQHKMLPFVGCKLAFVGYSENEEQRMTEICIKNGGHVFNPEDASCTHIIVQDGYSVDSEHMTVVYMNKVKKHTHILKDQWFWACMQLEAKAHESLYVFKNPNSTRGNKRKRTENIAHQLDVTSSEKSLDLKSLDISSLTPRQQVCLELYQTETNYVDILKTIMTVFKEPLECSDQKGGELLSPEEIKIIFGNLPPIFKIHQKIHLELKDMIQSWREDHSVGNLILKHAQEFLKSYPPFVNFFEKTKEVLSSCDSSRPRFHAFLEHCQSKPECERQPLQGLLIRPVQRLPSVVLLLNDILKHTPKNNSDHQALEKAIISLENVLKHLNEDKRKTEGQVKMFSIVNDIENCPPNLLSSHRNFVLQMVMQEVTDKLMKKRGPITMFLFTDVLEICKNRNKTANPLKSPTVTSSKTATLKHQSKPYKHLDLISLVRIKRIVDVEETTDYKNMFAIDFWSSKQTESESEQKELKLLLYAFALPDNICKTEFLHTFCQQIASSLYKADAENLLTVVNPQQLDLHVNENTGNALTKAFKKRRSNLVRALSMKRTPTERGLSGAASTIISPLKNFSTPSKTISTLSLSSFTNLNELNSSLTPSPVERKKMKFCSLGVSKTRY